MDVAHVRADGGGGTDSLPDRVRNVMELHVQKDFLAARLQPFDDFRPETREKLLADFVPCDGRPEFFDDGEGFFN